MAQIEVTRKTKIALLIFVSVLAVAVVAVMAFLAASDDDIASRGPTEPRASVDMSSQEEPELQTEVVMDGLDHPWDVAFISEDEMLVAERSGRILLHVDGESTLIKKIDDVYDQGEGGLLGLEVDNEFADNQFVYTCYASTNDDVRLVRWQLSDDMRALNNPLVVVDGMPLNPSGRHSGCRVRMDTNNVLWIGTGDAAIGTHPQDPESLGGKVLRVDRSGEPASGNLDDPFDPRIFSYGHRNVQGIALYDTPKGDNAGFSVEHGSRVDDEVNTLVPGNFGWDPVPFYNERVPMTDAEKFADAIEAAWSSGSPTIAPSGADILTGEQWLVWNGALAMAVLKDEHLRLQKYDENNSLVKDEVVFKEEFGRIRSAVQGPDGSLYLTTDNGSNQDQVIRVTPR